MYKLLFRLMFGVGILSLFVSAWGITHTAVFAEDDPTPTPTAKPFDYPGVDLLLPSAGTFSAEVISTFGYRVENFAHMMSGQQRVTIWISEYRQRGITAGLLLSGTQILETYVDIDISPNFDVTETIWKLLDPKPIFMNYESPTTARANLIATGNGLIGSMVVVWENDGLAVSYGTLLKNSDLDSDIHPLKLNLCFSPDRVVGFTAWFALEGRDILEVIQHSHPHFTLAGQPFSPTMFTNAPNLATLAQRLASGECLETRREVWFGSQ